MQCPSCLQEYIRIGTLQRPTRTIYIHRQTKKGEPIDWCMGKTANREGINVRKDPETGAQTKKSVASRLCDEVQLSQEPIWLPRETVNTEGKKERKYMPFVGFDRAKIETEYPSRFGAGREGRQLIAVSESGRITFSATLVRDILPGCKYVSPGWDAASKTLRFDGKVDVEKGKEGKMWELKTPKSDKDKSRGLNAAGIFRKIGLEVYDFKKAGNQTFVPVKVDAEKHIVYLTLPETQPIAKAKRPRMTKAEKLAADKLAATSKPNGVPAPSSTPAKTPVAPTPKVEEEEMILEG
jgi:hypothetical protein